MNCFLSIVTCNEMYNYFSISVYTRAKSALAVEIVLNLSTPRSTGIGLYASFDRLGRGRLGYIRLACGTDYM
jgi:hypothetical protein